MRRLICSVYCESFFNISSTASRDSSEKIFRDRTLKALWETEATLGQP